MYIVFSGKINEERGGWKDKVCILLDKQEAIEIARDLCLEDLGDVWAHVVYIETTELSGDTVWDYLEDKTLSKLLAKLEHSIANKVNSQQQTIGNSELHQQFAIPSTQAKGNVETAIDNDFKIIKRETAEEWTERMNRELAEINEANNLEPSHYDPVTGKVKPNIIIEGTVNAAS